MLQIYNSITKQKEPFHPVIPNKIGIYVCGSTVYDHCHIGHGRIFVCFDTIVRYLRAKGYQVTYVRNITDIDDKIIKRAQKLQVPYHELTQQMIAAMHEDAAALGTLMPDFEPRVTNTIPEIIELIQTLVNKGYAYTTVDGDVYFEVSKFQTYGALAQQNLEDLKAGARIDVTELKRAPLDFALWKAAKPDEPYWPSPWGNGRPGWHIECSAMAKKYLGTQLDIHGGGADLQFPHHQNELAQSEAANACKFVNYWLHAGLIQVNKEKMSKSLGNFFTIKEVLQKYNPEVLRYFYLASHYRSPINYSTENLDSAHAALQRFYLTLRDLPTNSSIAIVSNEFTERFYAAMDDDFNTPESLAVLFDLTREINKALNNNNVSEATTLGAQLQHLAGILGLLYQNPHEFLRADINAQEVEALIEARNLARKNKNWAEADKIRDTLAKMQIALEDTPKGTIWRKD